MQNNINFIDQYRFDDFKKYPFDFYFPEFNLVLEPGGDQHFIPINKWGDEDGYMGEWFIDFNLFTNRILEIMEGRI